MGPFITQQIIILNFHTVSIHIMGLFLFTSKEDLRVLEFVLKKINPFFKNTVFFSLSVFLQFNFNFTIYYLEKMCVEISRTLY